MRMVLQIDVDLQDDDPQFERAEFRVPLSGDYVVGSDFKVYISNGWGKGPEVVLIPSESWRNATPQDVADQITGKERFQWRVRRQEDHGWKENKKVCGYRYEYDKYMTEDGDSYNYAQVLPLPKKDSEEGKHGIAV